MTPSVRGGRGAGTDASEGVGAGGRAGAHVVVFACGDPFRGDDAVAPLAVSKLPSAVAEAADVRVIGALEVEQLVDLPPGDVIVIVDAVVGVEPGRIVELSLGELVAAASGVVTTSTHQLPLDRVVALAEVLRDEPLAGRFVGLGIGSVVQGGPLSEPVTTALPAFGDAIVRAIRDLAPEVPIPSARSERISQLPPSGRSKGAGSQPVVRSRRTKHTLARR